MAGRERGQRIGHRVELDLPGAPSQRVVVRGRHAAAEDVDEEPPVERRAAGLDLDSALA